MRAPFIAAIAIIVIACAVFVLSLMTTPAHSATALWEKFDYWTVYGNTDTTACSAEAEYKTGRTLIIMFMKDNASLVITGLDVTPGKSYSTIVTASTGAKGVMDAYAIDNSSVAFFDINAATVRALANARSFFIQGLGDFQLAGSKRAMASAWDCYETLSGKGV